MIKTVQLAGYELRRFNGPLPILGLIFVVLLPLMYGAIYLWSAWDPYGKLDQLPVAVVELDEPVTTAQGATVSAGDRLVAELKADPDFDWQFVAADTAATGLAEGDYYLTITIPPDFSANLASGATDDPTRAVVSMRRNDANGYVAGVLASSAQSTLEAAIDRAAIGAYVESVFSNLDVISADVDAAAGTATLLSTTATETLTAATDLQTTLTATADTATQVGPGVDGAKAASAQLVTSATAAQTATGALTTSLAGLQTSAGEIGPGAQDVADTAAQLSASVGPSIGSITTNATNISTSAGNLADTINTQLDLLTGPENSLAAEIAALQALPQTPELTAIIQELNSTGSQLTSASNTALANADGIGDAASAISDEVGSLSSLTTDLAAISSTASDVASAADGLDTQLAAVDTNAATVDTEVANLTTGATDVDTALTDVQAGTQQLGLDLGTAQDQSLAVIDGLTRIEADSAALSASLTAAADRVPTLTPDQRSNAEQVLSAPADVQLTIDNAAGVYGRGLAPFFFAIAIWVFGIAVFTLLRPVSLRALVGRASSGRVAVAGWLPVLGLAVVGSLVLFGVTWLGLGLNPVNAGGSVGVILLAAACFTALAHLLRTWLGAAGTAIAIVLLIVQLSSAAGVFPVETMPAPFRAIHPVMPMTYVVDALRITFTGGLIDHLWQDIAILAGIALVAVAASVLVVSRHRRLRESDLHPALP